MLYVAEQGARLLPAQAVQGHHGARGEQAHDQVPRPTAHPEAGRTSATRLYRLTMSPLPEYTYSSRRARKAVGRPPSPSSPAPPSPKPPAAASAGAPTSPDESAAAVSSGVNAAGSSACSPTTPCENRACANRCCSCSQCLRWPWAPKGSRSSVDAVPSACPCTGPCSRPSPCSPSCARRRPPSCITPATLPAPPASRVPWLGCGGAAESQG